MISKAAVVGASGYVGGRLLQRLGARGIGAYAGRPAPGLVAFDIRRDPLEALVSAAGATLSHLYLVGAVADPERCVKHPEAAREINVTGAIRLMQAALEAGITPVFLSTDYVFQGDLGGYVESDPVGPTTVYGQQKAEVEAWLAAAAGGLTARLSKVVGPETDTHSVLGPWVADIKAGRPIRSATDQVFSPAAIDDIARALIDLGDANERGVWHVAGPEPFSRYDLAKCLADEIAKIAPSVRVDLSACSLRDIPFIEVRPLRTFLNTDRLMAWLPWRFQSMKEVCAATARQHFS